MRRHFLHQANFGLADALARIGLPACRGARRSGFTLLELEVALFVLAIAISGLFPVLNMHSKTVKSLEDRSYSSGTWYMVPSSDIWARKLGAAASLVDTAPSPEAAQPVLTVDDGDTAYVESDASWVAGPSASAYQTDSKRHAPPPENTPPSPSVTATWTFNSLSPGWYQVQTTWSAAADQSDAARYVVFEGETSLADLSVNQRIAPSGPIDQGCTWQTLTTAYIRNPSVTVRLDGESSPGYVVADAVRLVPTENKVLVLSLVTSPTSDEATAHVSFEWVVPH